MSVVDVEANYKRDEKGRFVKGSQGGPGRPRSGKNIAQSEGHFIITKDAFGEFLQILTLHQAGIRIFWKCPDCGNPTELMWDKNSKRVYMRCKCGWARWGMPVIKTCKHCGATKLAYNRKSMETWCLACGRVVRRARRDRFVPEKFGLEKKTWLRL